MNEITRREAIIGIAATSAAVLSLSNDAEASDAVPAFRGEHQPKPLPFDPSKLNGISEKLIRSHWENNYTASVNALNKVEQRLLQLQKEKDLPAYIYGDLKREELLRTGSVVLHDLYFANLGGDGKIGGDIKKAAEDAFGGFDAWEAEFAMTAKSLSGTSGWTVLAYNSHTLELHNYWASDHAHNAPFSVPLLVLDMYEHSYQMDYGAAAAKYVDAFMKNINWAEVNKRFESARKSR